MKTQEEKFEDLEALVAKIFDKLVPSLDESDILDVMELIVSQGGEPRKKPATH